MRTYYRKLAREEVDFAHLQTESARTGLLSAQKRGEITDPWVIDTLRTNTEFASPASLDDLKVKFESKNASINLRIRGAQAYAKILKNVAEGHQKLCDNADKLSSREVLSAALSYGKTIKSLTVDFEKAF